MHRLATPQRRFCLDAGAFPAAFSRIAHIHCCAPGDAYALAAWVVTIPASISCYIKGGLGRTRHRTRHCLFMCHVRCLMTLHPRQSPRELTKTPSSAHREHSALLIRSTASAASSCFAHSLSPCCYLFLFSVLKLAPFPHRDSHFAELNSTSPGSP